MVRSTLALLFTLVSALVVQAQGLAGKIEGKSYVSPTGIFKVVIPVLPELGGEITDTPNVVTFQDDFNEAAQALLEKSIVQTGQE